MCGSAAGTELCSSPPGKRELEEGPGQTPLIAISIFFQPGLPLAGRRAPSSRREGERCAYFFARRPPQAPRAALPGLLQYRGEAGKKCGRSPVSRSVRVRGARPPPPSRCPPGGGVRSGAPRTPGIVAAPVQSLAAAAGAPSLAPLPSCRRERALPASAVNGGDGGEVVGGGRLGHPLPL